MSRALTTDFLRTTLAQEIDEVVVFLLTITHDALSDPVRVSSDPTSRVLETDTTLLYGTRSRGQIYYFYPFALTLPEDGDEGPSAMSVSLDNVSRELTATLRAVQGPPTITVEVVLASTPDTVEALWPGFLLTDAKITATTITGTLALEAQHNEPFPGGTFNPTHFPGCF